MRITFVSDTYKPQANGVARTLERLVRDLRDREHDVDVIRPAVLGAEEDGMEVKSVPLPGYDGVHLGYAHQTELHRRWTAARPDVVYVATEMILGVTAIHVARKLEIPVVSGFHTNFQQYLAYYNLSGLEPIATTYLRLVHNASVRTFVPCEDVREALKEVGFDNLELLPKGVDTELFDPKRRDEELRKSWGVSADDPVCIYVGRMAAEKNIPLFCQSLERMKARNPRLKCVFVGDGPKKPDLQRQFPDGVFTGALFGEELARHYASADVFVFPSTTETFGNVVLEAVASGLVTVAYDYAAARQHLRHGKNGLLAAFGEESAFLDCCDQAVDLQQWKDLREEARTTAISVSWAKVIDDFEDCLTKVANEEPNYTSPLRYLLTETS
ncbi:MAG: glycosyltransferase family 1 protein [Verrucomicrobiota bacterium]